MEISCIGTTDAHAFMGTFVQSVPGTAKTKRQEGIHKRVGRSKKGKMGEWRDN
jgi:hypothetical protein